MASLLPLPLALLLLLLLLSPSISAAPYSSLANNASCLPNYNLDWVSGNNGGTVIAAGLEYPLCAYDVHHGPSSTTWTYLYGGSDSAVESTLFTSTNGFRSLASSPRADATMGPHRYGQGAVLANGNVIFMGGQQNATAGAASAMGDVYYSTNHGQSFSVATLTAPAKWAGQLLAMPYTSTMVLIGGNNPAGSETNDVWMSSDGIGAVWTVQATALPIPTNAIAGAVALYDSSYVNPSLYSSPNSTILFFLEYGNGEYWTSYDLGRTWTAAYIYPFSTAANSLTHRDWLLVVADLDNYIYTTGMENEPDPTVWMSSTKGQTWSILQQTTHIPGYPTSLQYEWAKYNCMAALYSNDTKAKQLVIYGYQTYMSDGSVWQSLLGQLNVPIGQSGYGLLPNATIASALPIASLPSTVYPSCAYNLHTLTSNPLLFLAGGYSPSGGVNATNAATINAAYTSTNAGTSFTLKSSSVWASAPVYNAGAAYLLNGRLLLIGGQSGTAVTAYSSAVYSSADQGATWTMATANATFGARTNFATCVMPGTNTVVIVGGSVNNNGTARTDNSIYASTDSGVTWTLQGSLPVTTLAGSCVFLYDNAAVSSAFTSTTGTLLVFTHTMRLYRSYTMGASFDPTPSMVAPGPSGYQFVPFSTQYDATSTRYQTEIVADADNYLYAMAGLNVFDNGLYFSGDLGFTWYRIKQSNRLNSAQFIQASTSCLGLSYVQSGSSYVKTLTLYGGVQVLFDNGMNYSAITITVDSAPSFIPATTGTAVSTTAMAQRANAAQLWCVDPVQPGIQWETVTSSATMPFAEYPLCASDVHQGVPTAPTSIYMYGGYVSSANAARLYGTTNGFQSITNTSHLDTTVGARRMGSAAVLGNGNLVLLGGQTGTTAATATSDVFLSSDKGATFTKVVGANYPAKYEAQVLSIPYTNWLVAIGGYNTAGAETNDVWLSTDGQGAVWTQQASSLSVSTNALAASAVLYDSKFVNPSLYSSPNSTILFFLEYSSGAYWTSNDLGRTWSTNFYYPMSSALTSASSITHRDWQECTSDHDSIIYCLGEYNNPDEQTWASFTKGQTFIPLQIAPSHMPGISSYIQMMWAEYGCVATQFGINSQTGQLTKQLVVYGYYTYLTDGTQWSALVGTLTNVPVGKSVPMAPVATLSSSLPVSAVTNGFQTACAYNVHARNGVMMAYGGVFNLSDPTTLNSQFTISVNSFASANATSLYTYNLNSVPYSAAGGLTLLNNGAILQFGGQTSPTTFSNTVYSSSSSNGIAFTQVANAPWSPRAGFITCTMPYSNLVLVIGGTTAAGNVNDIWASSDGLGAAWSKPATTVPWSEAGILAGTCVFLYDGAQVPSLGSTQAYSTLLVFTQTNHYYRSVTGGASWITQPNPYTPLQPTYQTAPWSSQFDSSKTRYGIEVVADYDNHLYAMAGTGVWDNTMWWSGDSGFLWYRMTQINTLNSAYFIQASTSCLGLNYVRNPAATGGYNKTLVLYAGNIQFDDGATKVGALIITVADPVVFLPNNSTALTFNPRAAAVSSSAIPRSSSAAATSAPLTTSAPIATSAPLTTSTPPSATSIPTTTSAPAAATSTPAPSATSARATTSAPAVTSPPSATSAAAMTSTPTPSTTSAPAVAATSQGSVYVPPVEASDSSSSGLSGGAIAGIVVGSVVGGMLLCFMLVACFVARVRSQNQKKDPTTQPSYQSRQTTDDDASSAPEVEMH